MPRKHKPVPERVPSRLQLSKWERQKKLQRLVLISGVFVIAAVLGILSFGYYDNRIKPSLAEKEDFSQAALKVNGKVFTKEALYKMLMFFSYRREETANAPLLNSTIEYLQNSEILEQEARKLNIQVSPEEIDKDLRKSFGGKEEDFARVYRLNLEAVDLTDEEYRNLVRWELVKTKLRDQVIVPTVPREEMHAQVERILLPTEDEAKKVVQQLQNGAAFPALVKELSQDPASKDKDGNVGWMLRDDVSKTFGEVTFKLKKGELSQPFFDKGAYLKGSGYWILKVTEKLENSVKAHGILLRTEAEAREVKKRLEQGEDFVTLAKEVSADAFTEAVGGDLGEVTRGSFSPEVEQVLFNLEPGALGGPVLDATRTLQGGYWVVRGVEEPQMRELEKSKLEARQAEAFQNWFEEKKKDYSLENFLDTTDKRNAIMLKAATEYMIRLQQKKSGRR
ncbi:MAG: peptidylprolyl isomerase [Chloroflexi bacterium]|nr:peptidylprolyl isomerase [Chloroflexota bacterium]